MSQYILHHFDASPFAEKVRLVFGLKQLAWRSVQIPMIMPKPDLTCLTGGYRKTPVLQIGADIYCDTSLIAQEIDRRTPAPPLFPSGQRGLTLALSRWGDKTFFEPGAALSMGENPQVPDVVIEDRKAFFNFMDFGKLAESLPAARMQLQANCALLEDALSCDSDYLDGNAPGYTDIQAWFVIWMTRANVPSAESLLAPFALINRWSGRMATIGHGDSEDIPADEALGIARSTSPGDEGSVMADNPLGLARGDAVVVSADDYGRDEVAGELLNLDFSSIKIRRTDDRVGDLNVHFPQLGYQVRKR
ncbi:MAG: glutathione S-transferase family protein [Woeseiaceae bacterium]|nr:glutathione S-transferase family protein [Woeseiaceae bacterium]